jgi:hypothetical protein
MSFKDRLVLGMLMGGTLFVLLGRLAPLFHVGLPLPTLALAAFALAALLMLMPPSDRVATLHAEEKVVVVTSAVFKFWPRSRRIDLSGYAWVRVKGDRGKAVPWLRIQVGTPGYKTLQLMAIPGTGSNEIEASLKWCARIAEALQIENKGYKEVW